MVKDKPESRGTREPSGHARRWVQTKLLAESVRSSLADEAPRQLTVRLNPVVAALFEAMSERLGVTKNSAANVLIGAALVEAVSGLPEDAREELRKNVEKRLGRKLDLTPPPEPPGVLRAVLDDVMSVVEEIKGMFRGSPPG